MAILNADPSGGEVIGTGEDDQFVGGPGNDDFDGLDGFDSFAGEGGAFNIFNGGNGDDLLDTQSGEGT